MFVQNERIILIRQSFLPASILILNEAISLHLSLAPLLRQK